MSPSNLALVKLHKADQALRGAQGRLEGASRSVRVLERKIADLNERLRLAQAQLRENQSKSGALDLEIKTRDTRIERLREQQQSAKNHKEYQAFLTEINTEKIDKNKVEDELLKIMEATEKSQREVSELSGQIAVEQKKCEETRQELSSRLSELEAEVERLKPAKEEAASGVNAGALAMFERLSERYEGEPMAGIAKPDRRREEYVCTACNMSLVADIYNRLHTSNDPVICPNCRRILYIPEELTPENAINAKPRERRERATRAAREKGSGAVAASVGRQTSAADISRSIVPEPDQGDGGTPPTAPPEAQ